MSATKPVSFMNERTAEYALVINLIEHLSDAFTHLTPFFFWATREGRQGAREGYGGRVRIIAAYARRPKVHAAKGSEIQVKFNALLFDHARLLHAAGIPLLAGVPCISRLLEFHLGADCAWFQIQSENVFDNDVYASIALQTPATVKLHPSSAPVKGPIRRSEIVTLLERSAPLAWGHAIQSLNGVRQELRRVHGSRSWFGPYVPYRPFYVVAME